MEQIKLSLNTIEDRKPISKTVTHSITYNTKKGSKTREYSQIKVNTNKPRLGEIKKLRRDVINYIKDLSNDELINLSKNLTMTMTNELITI